MPKRRSQAGVAASISGLFGVVGLVGLAACDPSPPANVAAVSPDATPPTRDVVLVVVDTLRADAVEQSLTPTLDHLATDGMSVPYAWSPSTWTAPSTLSLMVGAHVREHGWDMPFPRHMEAAGKSYPTLDDYPTLAEVLQSQGYATQGVYANPLLSRKLGWERGFDTWEGVPDRQMSGYIRRLVADLRSDEPLFLYAHLIGPHQPLKPSNEARQRWGVKRSTVEISPKGIRLDNLVGLRRDELQDQYVRAYHAEVEDTDRRLKHILSALGSRERDALIIVTSDHGELLGEHHLWGHDDSVWNALTHVPMVVWGGDHPALPETLSTAAIPDLVTQSLGIPATWPLSVGDPPILVSQREGHLAISGDGQLRGVWKPGEDGFVGAWDVLESPEEDAIVGDFSSTAAVHMYRHWWQAITPAGKRETLDRGLDEETQKLLEELGYMGEAPASGE